MRNLILDVTLQKVSASPRAVERLSDVAREVLRLPGLQVRALTNEFIGGVIAVDEDADGLEGLATSFFVDTARQAKKREARTDRDDRCVDLPAGLRNARTFRAVQFRNNICEAALLDQSATDVSGPGDQACRSVGSRPCRSRPGG